MAARKMPQNIEAEMSVLGVAFLNPKEVTKIVEDVSVDMFFEEKRELLENQNFTPDDTECYRKPWIRKRHIDIKEIVSSKEKLTEKLLNEVKMIRLKYGEKVKTYDIIKKLEEWNN